MWHAENKMVMAKEITHIYKCSVRKQLGTEANKVGTMAAVNLCQGLIEYSNLPTIGDQRYSNVWIASASNFDMTQRMVILRETPIWAFQITFHWQKKNLERPAQIFRQVDGSCFYVALPMYEN